MHARGRVRRRAAWLLLAVATAAGAAGTDSAPAPVPLEAYGRLPTIGDVALSPDGAKLALIVAVGDRQILAVVRLQDNTTLGRYNVGDAKVRAIEWADDRHLLVTSASSSLPFGVVGQRHEMHLLQCWDADTGKFRPLVSRVSNQDDMMNVVFGRPVIVRGGKDTLVYVHGEYFSERRGQMALVRINLDTRAETMLKGGNEATQYWLVNERGDVVAEQDYYDAQHRWAIRLVHDGHTLQTVAGTAPLDYPEIVGLDTDGAAAIVGLREEGNYVYRRLSLADGTWGSQVSPTDPISGIIHEPGGQRMIGTAYVGDEVHYRFVDPELQRRWDWVQRVFHDERVTYQDVSADRQHFLVSVLGPKHGYGYYLADAAEHLTRRVGEIYANVPQVAEVRKIAYPAADGLEIPAYLTLPPGRPEKGLPLIVMPHGGPEARDEFGFDWWAQALASQGYVVLQPNYRGSNLDVGWVEKGYGEWGRRMQTDLTDGLQYLAKQGLIDPQRACIVGASYGGYAAMAGAALQPGSWRCAVAVAGISDPEHMLRWVEDGREHNDNETSRYWNRFMGVKGPDDKRLAEISPLVHAASIGVPIMLIHGKDDTTVPYDQSARLAKALEKLGKPYEFVTLAKEDHYLSRSETRLQMLTSSVAFLRHYNPPQ